MMDRSVSFKPIQNFSHFGMMGKMWLVIMMNNPEARDEPETRLYSNPH